MLSDPMIVAAAVLVALTSTFVLISKDWRYCILALVVQYVGVFLLVNVSWPLEMAVAKMVAGWMSGAILGMAMASSTSSWQTPDQSLKFGTAFRLMAAIIVALAIASLVLRSDSWLGMIKLPIRWGSFILIGYGMLQLGFTSHPMRVVVGLLTALSGFEVIYAAVETSTLVTGLLAGANLGLALVGAYLLVAPGMESNP